MEGPEGTRLASQAFEAINEAVRSAAADTLPLVGQLIPLTLQKLNATMAMAAAAPDARERQSEMQARWPMRKHPVTLHLGLPRRGKYGAAGMHVLNTATKVEYDQQNYRQSRSHASPGHARA